MSARLRAGLAIPALVSALAFAALMALGLWQLERKAWKENLIAMVDRRAADAPVALPPRTIWSSLEPDTAEFSRVQLRVAFTPGQETLVFAGGGSSVRADAKSGGYFVFAPGRLPSGDRIVVNRGFVADRTSIPPPPSEPTEIVGAIRFASPTSWFVADHDAAAEIWTVRDPVAMAQAKGWGTVAPFYIEQESPVPPGGLPHPSPLKVQLRNEHLQYAVTWFGLATVLAVMFAVWAFSRRDGNSSGQET